MVTGRRKVSEFRRFRSILQWSSCSSKQSPIDGRRWALSFQTSQTRNASISPAFGSRVGMNSWPTKPSYLMASSFFMMGGS